MKARTLFGVAMLVCGSASAQPSVARDDTAEPTGTPRVGDAALRAVKGHRVILATGQGNVTGKVLAVESDSVTIARDDGEVITISRAQIAGLRLADMQPTEPVVAPPVVFPPPPVGEAPPADEPKPAPRYFGAHIGMAPGIALDVDYQYFHAFMSTALVFPLVSSGQIFAFTAGAGATFPLAGSNWRFDIFGHVVPMGWQGFSYYQRTSVFVGVGVGMGFHYTAPSGWCIGIKLPVLGAAAGDYQYNSTVGLVAGMYYLGSSMSLPVFSFGYRF